MPENVSVLLWLNAYFLGLLALVFVRLLVHEMAHALAGWLVGHRILLIQVGAGPLLLRLPLFGGSMELRMHPRHGAVFSLLPRASWFRLRRMISVSAGPLADIGLVVTLFLVAWSPSVRAITWWFLLLLLLAVGMAALVLLSFVPRHLPHINGPNDILQLVRLWKMDVRSTALIAADHERQLAMHESWRLFAKGKPQAALAHWDARVRDDDSGVGVNRCVLVWACEGTDAALQELARERAVLERFAREQSLLQSAPGPAWKQQIAQLNAVLDTNAAFFAVQSDRPELLPEAERAINRALAVMPREPAMVRTFGLVQLALGNVERGMENLAWAWQQSEPPWLAALCACYLAHGHALVGETEQAHRFLAWAVRTDPHCLLLGKYRKLVAEIVTGKRQIENADS
jgi:Peptidase family M50